MMHLHASPHQLPRPNRGPAPRRPTSEYEAGYLDGYNAREQILGRDQPVLRRGRLAYDRSGDVVLLDNKPFHLSRQQRRLMAGLLTGRVLTNEAAVGLLYPLGEPERCVDPLRIVKVHICKMRRELAAAGVPPVIETCWGVGYVMPQTDA